MEHVAEVFNKGKTVELLPHVKDLHAKIGQLSMDNVFIERLWKSVEYKDIYFKSYASMIEAKRDIAEYFKFYNEKRWHQNFKKTPGMVYFGRVNLTV